MMSIIALFNFCTIHEVQNADNAITFKTTSYDKLCEVYATAGGTISNDCHPSCSAVYSNKNDITAPHAEYKISKFYQPIKSASVVNL